MSKLKTRRESDQDDPLTYDILGAAIEVHRRLGPGLLEGLYEEALCIELDERKLRFERQKLLALDYRGRAIGNYFIDLVVENSVIIELKAVGKLAPVHEAQLLSYLKLANLHIGLLINFNEETLMHGVKRLAL